MNRRVAGRPGGDSGWWLVAVGVAFTAAELLFVSPRTGLSWDEAVYVSQVSGHAPAAWFDPARARGIPLLVAPVAALTSSVAALRVYLSVACGLGLTVALWTWRRLRPAWVLGLAGVLFGGLWVAQYYGPQAMPDMWSALGGLAAVGCFLRAADRAPGWLAGLGASVAFVTLVRPGDAVYLAAPLVVAAIVVWRSWPRAAVVVAGLVAGGAEWVAEAYARFGGIASRLHAAGGEQGRVRSALRAARRASGAERADAVPPVHRRRPVSRTGPVVVPAAGACGAGRRWPRGASAGRRVRP